MSGNISNELDPKYRRSLYIINEGLRSDLLTSLFGSPTIFDPDEFINLCDPPMKREKREKREVKGRQKREKRGKREQKERGGRKRKRKREKKRKEKEKQKEKQAPQAEISPQVAFFF